MPHVRKRIRRVLNEMGFDNNFQICSHDSSGCQDGDGITVTIKDWEPHRDAIQLKKYLMRCAEDASMEVEFQLLGHGERHRTWKPGIMRH